MIARRTLFLLSLTAAWACDSSVENAGTRDAAGVPTSVREASAPPDDTGDSGLVEDSGSRREECGVLGPVETATTSSYLDPDAADELRAIGVGQYEGRAVATGTEQWGDLVKVDFDPVSGPICYKGAPFSAFYADRGVDRTIIVLGGGGACWSSMCSADYVVYRDNVERNVLTGPTADTPSNCYGDWNIVFAPSCDGSIFAGNHDHEFEWEIDYETNEEPIRYYRGRRNLAAAVDLAVEHFGESSRVVIMGFSAGGYGTIPAMLTVRLAFPTADLFVVNDSGPGLHNPARTEHLQERIEEWRFNEFIPPSCTECDGGRGQLVAMYGWMLDHDPNVRISLLSYRQDRTIGTFYNGLTGSEYEALLLEETDKIHRRHPERFKRFLVPGRSHVVTLLYYEHIVADGVAVDDWLWAMATGDDTTWVDWVADDVIDVSEL